MSFSTSDGTLATAAVLGAHNKPASAASPAWSLGAPGTTLHSGVDTDLFRPGECVYLRRAAGAPPDGRFGVACGPSLHFKRIMLNNHRPNALLNRDLQVTDLAAPRSGTPAGAPAPLQAYRTANVTFSKYNELGYQFLVATGSSRSFWLHWQLPQRVDPDAFTLHKMDKMGADDYVTLVAKEAQVCYIAGS